MNFKKGYLVLLFFISQISVSQEGIAVYSDYLSDNLYIKFLYSPALFK